MRTLVVIPIIHTEHDMGSLLEQIKLEYVTRYGHEKWTEHLRTINEVWGGIQTMIAELDLPYGGLRLYQDGLPVCHMEAEIVRDVAARGSINHQILIECMERGAQLMGTEDPQLLLQEYQFHQEVSQDRPSLDQEHQHQEQSRRLLLERDRFIAERINSTLLSGETGLLFLGMAHSVEPLLAHDILVRHLLPFVQGTQARLSP